MKRLLRAAAALLCAAGFSAFGQGVRYDSRAETVQTNMPAGANAPVLAIPNSKVLVCTDSGCVTPANIYQDQALTVAAPNPLTANTQGQWGFWGASGTYWYKITTTQGIVYGPYPITLGGTGGGGGGLITAAETPSGTINGSNHVFTLSNAPTLLLLGLNGLLMTQGVDYTLSGNTITFTASLPYTGDRLFANYFYGSGSLTPFSQTPTGVINGSNTAFTLTHSPQILFLTRNGVQLVVGTDYTLSGTNLTMMAAPQTGDIFNAQYFY